MKTTRPVIDLRLGVWRDRLYFLLAWWGVHVEAWTPEHAPSAYLSALGGHVVRAIEDSGYDEGTYTCTEDWIREAVQYRLAVEKTRDAIARARQQP